MTRRLRLHELSQLRDHVAALRGKTQLGAAIDDHAPVKSEALVTILTTNLMNWESNPIWLSGGGTGRTSLVSATQRCLGARQRSDGLRRGEDPLKASWRRR